MDRIEKLRNIALEYKDNRTEFFYRFYKKYSSLENTPEAERYRESFYYAFETLTPSITDGELVLGKYPDGLNVSEKSEWQNIYQPIAQARAHKAGFGQDSHMAVDYELILNSGLSGIIEKINEYMASCDASSVEFYKTCKRCLEAVICHAQNYAICAETMANTETDSARKAELLKLAQILRKVPMEPAESFYEAVQSVHFVTYCLSLNPYREWQQQFQLGHPDRYLLPYYEADIKSGAITKEFAQLLLDCLGVQINMRVPNGLSSGYMVGGRDEDGKLVENELTSMLMQVVDNVRLVYPAVGLCYAQGMDDKYLEKACEILLHGRSHPAIFNDDIITAGLIHYGVPENEAHNYIHSTCVEITPVASSNVWVASPYTNMPQLLLDVMDREYPSFDALFDALFYKLDCSIKENFEEQNAIRKIRNDNSQNPLLSCFVNDCLEKGIDIEQGGAKYNWITPSFVGIANLVDSLFAIKELVFEKNEFTLSEFKEIVDNDFAGKEDLRMRILNSIPKYGNDLDEIDKYFGIITEHISSECEKYNGMHQNGNLIPSAFCWIQHEIMGSSTGATPDGRPANFPLGDGSGPCQGREMAGPTASILSSTKWSHKEFIGGVAVNMKFSKNSLGEKSVDTLKTLVKTYLERGGFEMQINVVDKTTLEDALKNPENYRDLVVRIGGYSDYFTRLTPNMQQEVILRTAHEI